MGYTHYFRRPEKLDNQKFELFIEDVKEIITHVNRMGIPIVDWAGEEDTQPEITSTVVRFNGSEIDSHETFHVERDFEPRKWEKPEKGRYFSFCKTARQPYDIAVTTCLLALHHHFGDEVHISSDGDEQDWQPAYELSEKLFNRKSTLTI